MRLAVLSTSYPRSSGDDAGIFVQRLVQALTTQAITCQVIVPQDKDEPPTESSQLLTVNRYRYGLFLPGALAFGSGIVPNLRRRPWLIFQAPLLLLGMTWQTLRIRSSIDLIHANWLPSGLAGALASILTGKPLVITLRGEDMRMLRNPALWAICWPALRIAKRITTVSESFLEQIKSAYHLPTDKVCLIPNGVELTAVSAAQLETFCATKRLEQQGNHLLFIGTIIPRKRVEMLIELLAQPSLRGFTLILCGRAEDQDHLAQLRQRASDLGVNERVRFEGQVPPNEIPLYLAASKAYISASEFEGRPNAVLEAISSGTPVCLSDIPAHREVVKDGESGLLFSPSDLPHAAAQLTALLADRQAQQRMTSAARRHIADQSWQTCATQYLELFHSVMSD